MFWWESFSLGGETMDISVVEFRCKINEIREIMKRRYVDHQTSGGVCDLISRKFWSWEGVYTYISPEREFFIKKFKPFYRSKGSFWLRCSSPEKTFKRRLKYLDKFEKAYIKHLRK